MARGFVGFEVHVGMKPATLARWSGRGEFASFRTTVEGRLGVIREGGSLRRCGNSLVIEGSEPLGTAAELQHLPGLSWLAAGFKGRSVRDLSEQASVLALRYLRMRDRFKVVAESSGGLIESDLAGAVTSAILGAVKGSKVTEGAPKVIFRAAFDGSTGVVGVQVREGPGGEPTGNAGALCLVSGGRHSSVVAWMSLVAGYRLALVHARQDDQSLREAARLYSELSHRADPRGMSLTVLEGNGAMRALFDMVIEEERPVFSGFHGTSAIPGYFGGRLLAPLSLLPESDFSRTFRELSLRGYDGDSRWGPGQTGRVSRRSFGGVVADVSEVLGGLA
jgi:hypothetical protein